MAKFCYCLKLKKAWDCENNAFYCLWNVKINKIFCLTSIIIN